MNKFLLSLISILQIVLLISCGGTKDKTSITSSAVIKKTTIGNTPIWQSYYDKDCQGQKGLSKLGAHSYRALRDGSLDVVLESFNEYNSLNGISGNTIENIYEGQAVQFTIQDKKWSDYNVLSQGNKINLCKKTRLFPINTFEDSALSVLQTIDQANKYFKSINHQNPYRRYILPKTNIYLQQITEYKFIFTTENEKNTVYLAYETDNAYYDSRDDSLHFYPQSEEVRDHYITWPLWNIQFTGAHEYGHLIFHSIISSSKPSFSIYKSIQKNKNTINTLVEMDLLKYSTDNDSKRDVTFDTAIDGLSEGFADLFAYYTLNEHDQLSNVRQFQYQRQIDERYLGYYHNKKLSTKLINDYFSSIKNDYEGTLDYQDEHIIGAIFAYGINKLLSTVVNSPQEKGKLLIEWLGDIENYYKIDKKLHTPKEYLSISLDYLIKKLNKQKSKLTKSQCKILKDVFRYYYNWSKLNTWKSTCNAL